MFKGFQTKFPEYEVITPQTNLSFTIRSLTVQEEEKLKASFITPGKVTEHLNKAIYEAFVQKPDEVKEYNDFLRKTTVKDRDALLYGLYHITYEEIRNYDVRCAQCNATNAVTVNASDTFSANGYPLDADITKQEIKVELPVTKGVFAYIKQPTLFDELSSNKATMSSSVEISTEAMIINRFEEDIDDAPEPAIYDSRMDVLEAYQTLPARDKRAIHKTYMDNFGIYGIELKMKMICQSCMKEDIIELDLVENFFRMVYSA